MRNYLFFPLVLINKVSFKFYRSPLWKYILFILYGILAILFLTALIVPATLVYLLATKSRKRTYTFHSFIQYDIFQHKQDRLSYRRIQIIVVEFRRHLYGESIVPLQSR